MVGSGGDDELIPILEDALSVPVFAPAEAQLALARGAALASAQNVDFAFTDDAQEFHQPRALGRRRRPLRQAGPLALLVAGVLTFTVSVSVAVSLQLAPRQRRRPRPSRGPPPRSTPQTPAAISYLPPPLAVPPAPVVEALPAPPPRPPPPRLLRRRSTARRRSASRRRRWPSLTRRPPRPSRPRPPRHRRRGSTVTPLQLAQPIAPAPVERPGIIEPDQGPAAWHRHG